METEKQGVVAWQSPSNIALVKYWGKHDNQLPNNTSISFTLSSAFTETSIVYQPKANDGTIAFSFLFEGKPKPSFNAKIQKFLESIQTKLPFLSQYHLEINSTNSFPHSTGIASSAASMSALALCLLDIDYQIKDQEIDADFWLKASELARLGSGSACRSVFPNMAIWGKHQAIPNSSNEYAIPFTAMHSNFNEYQDAILIISSEEKSVSSRAGHALMENNPFASVRYQQAQENMLKIMDALESGNQGFFTEIVEAEALTLHALMMCSSPSFILLKPNTLKIIDLIKTFRQKNNVSLCYTLDAGPNLHLLYPKKEARIIEDWIEKEVKQYCEAGKVIYDSVGSGPKKIK
ncbi:MAG: diphosphomevalonate decarboxylase [Chitinophagales bacterium]|nr:diphosphomevalonate decarboxylase [Chitinophagales bacterium]